jgi:D-cysteine desulfhydrase family pyridoxal phosphate-dependent enzyme
MARAFAALPRVPFLTAPTPVEELPRLRDRLAPAPRLLIKRDDVIPFGFGGNKVRKLEYVAAAALADQADTLITCGGLQSNHARATAAAAARLGLPAVLVLNGEPPDEKRGNTLLAALLGAEIHYVPGRDERAPRMRALAGSLRRQGRRPFEIPLGASTPLGAIGFVRAVHELVDQGVAPDVIVHSTSSGGTQAGLLAGCALAGLPARILGISADDPPATLQRDIRRIVEGMASLIDIDPASVLRVRPPAVDARFVGEGYGVPTDASREAVELVARTEGIFLDPTYTAKAMAGLIQMIRERTFGDEETVMFWHTGGLPGIFR